MKIQVQPPMPDHTISFCYIIQECQTNPNRIGDRSVGLQPIWSVRVPARFDRPPISHQDFILLLLQHVSTFFIPIRRRLLLSLSVLVRHRSFFTAVRAVVVRRSHSTSVSLLRRSTLELVSLDLNLTHLFQVRLLHSLSYRTIFVAILPFVIVDSGFLVCVCVRARVCGYFGFRDHRSWSNKNQSKGLLLSV